MLKYKNNEERVKFISTSDLIEKIERIQQKNSLLLVQGLQQPQYDLIEHFINKNLRSNFRDQDFYLLNIGLINPENSYKDLVVNNFGMQGRMAPNLAINYAEKLIRPYLKSESCIAKKGNVLIFVKPNEQFRINSINSRNFDLDQRIITFIRHFKILNIE